MRPAPGGRRWQARGPGRFTDLTEACHQAARPRHVHEPDAARRTYVDDAYERLLAARSAGATHL